MCKSVTEGTTCRYGSKCNFAHSESELRRRPCINFQNGYCKFGENCRFDHTKTEVQPTQPKKIATTKKEKPTQKSVQPTNIFDALDQIEEPIHAQSPQPQNVNQDVPQGAWSKSLPVDIKSPQISANSAWSKKLTISPDIPKPEIRAFQTSKNSPPKQNTISIKVFHRQAKRKTVESERISIPIDWADEGYIDEFDEPEEQYIKATQVVSEVDDWDTIRNEYEQVVF